MPRENLPSRRDSVTQKFKILCPDANGKSPSLYVTVGLKDNRAPGEIKIVLSSTGSDERAYSDSLSYTLSIGLQYGVPLKAFVEQFIGIKFMPYGPVTGYEYIKFCSSPLDLAFRWLGIEYCQMWDLATLIPEETKKTEDKP